MFAGKRTRTISTALTKGGASKATLITFDYSGASEDSVMTAAERQWAITWQSNARNKFKTIAEIPATLTILVRETGMRSETPVTVETEAARAGTMSIEEQKKLAELLAANIKLASGPGAQQQPRK